MEKVGKELKELKNWEVKKFLLQRSFVGSLLFSVRENKETYPNKGLQKEVSLKLQGDRSVLGGDGDQTRFLCLTTSACFCETGLRPCTSPPF